MSSDVVDTACVPPPLTCRPLSLRPLGCRRSPEHVLRAWQGISAAGSGFTVQRLKNNMDTAKPIPPDMLLNALFAVEGHAPVVVEVQIHLEHILHIKEEEQHFVYELCRAKSIAAIAETARKHTANLRQLRKPSVVAEPTGDDRKADSVLVGTAGDGKPEETAPQSNLAK